MSKGNRPVVLAIIGLTLVFMANGVAWSEMWPWQQGLYIFAVAFVLAAYFGASS
jgi:hypothetical protein